MLVVAASDMKGYGRTPTLSSDYRGGVGSLSSADLGEEAGERPGEGLGLLHVGQMGRRLEDYQLRALDLLVHDLRRRDGRALVVLPDDDHRRYPDGADAVSEVEPRDGLAAADVAGRRCGPDHPAYGLDDGATLFLERRGEPPAQRSLHERVHPLRLGRVDALVPQ